VTARSGRPALPALLGALLLVVVGLAAGCSAAAESPANASATAAPASSAPSAAPAGSDAPESPVAGVVTSIDATGLTDVHGFTLRTVSGQDLTFVMGKLENGDEFPVGHLNEHLAAAAPVLVSFRAEGGKLVVYRLEDAP
jgi:hypothetical protein